MTTFADSKICNVENHLWEYRTILDQEGNDIKTEFQALPPAEINVAINQLKKEPDDFEKNSQWKAAPHPTFGSRPNTRGKDFDFQGDFQRLDFQLNLGANANLTKEQQAKFINVIYDNQEVLLHDEEIGFCDQITHTIPMMIDMPVYLPHHMIPHQLQGKIQQCLDTWLGKVLLDF